MAFTGKLGAGSSRPGNISLGMVGLQVPTVLSFTASMGFTGGIARQLATSQSFSGGLDFAGSLVTVLRGEPAVHSMTLQDTPDHRIRFEMG